jgi:hypothetical protein
MCYNIGEYQLADMFESVGHNRKGYETFDAFPFSGKFSEETDLRKSDILNLISKDKRISIENIANILNVDRAKVSASIAALVKAGALQKTYDDLGQPVFERLPGADEILEKLPPPSTTDILLRYSYQLRPGVEGPAVIPTTRPFCRKMMALSERGRVYSRADIEQISARLGYSVFERTGGFWNDKGEVKIHCRHYWMTEILIKKS